MALSVSMRMMATSKYHAKITTVAVKVLAQDCVALNTRFSVAFFLKESNRLHSEEPSVTVSKGPLQWLVVFASLPSA